MPDACIPLLGSSKCAAWNVSLISTDPSLYDQFPFLKGVTNLSQFDHALDNYIMGEYVKEKYVNILGCHGVDLRDTDSYYARYTASVICNGLIQSSKGPCNMPNEASRPLCADTCALMATSEEEITVNSNLCNDPNDNFMNQIRADFTVCSLPADSLTGSCISGADNEHDNCGYGPNTLGLCRYCASNSPNATDSCCVNSDAVSRCSGIVVPTITSTLPPIVTSTSPPSNLTLGTGAAGQRLSGGQIAGIVIGSVGGAALIAVLIALLFLIHRRRQVQSNNVLNQPNPRRKGSPPTQYLRNQQAHNSPAPVGRVARMSALREAISPSPGRSRGAAGISGGARYSDNSSDDIYASPGAMSKRIPPITGKRHGSLSSSSVFAGIDSDTSPRSGTAAQYSSPGDMTSGQSEQLLSFRDYYSQDDIHPGDKVSALWAYRPRASDEFELHRGDMLKVIGIWDDGWATGVRIRQRAEEYDKRRREWRDNVISNDSHRAESPPPFGEIRAFPLVCVCLPQHWRTIICGATPNDDGSSDKNAE